MVKITGRDKVQARLAGLDGEKAVKEVGQALYAGGEIIRAEAAHLITENSVSGRGHIPSLPGMPPNENLGTLRNNIETTQVAPLQVEVSSNAPYAVALEAGTSRMAPRPYMGPATRNKRKEVVELVQKAIARAIKPAP
jgi:HK97 gp10 family phage protein